MERERRSVTFAKISEDQTEMLSSRTVPDTNLTCEGFLFRRLLCALTRAVKQPTMIDAADAVTFHPTSGELCPPVRAAKSHDVRRAGLTTVECETFAHDLDWFSVAGPEFFRAMYRMPEPAHEFSGKTPWPSRDEILVAKFFPANVTLAFG
jgi:hypothetical protein